MQATVNTEDLVKALAKVGIATHCTTLPVLCSVKIEAFDEGLTLSATDLEMFITDIIDAEIKQVGAVVVAFRLLNAFIARSTAKEVHFNLQEKLLIVSHGENVANLEILDPAEFPPNFEIREAKPHYCDANDVVKPFRMIEHAISTEEARFALMGACIQSQEKGGCEMAATDSRRVAVYKSNLEIEGINVIVPHLTVSAVVKVFEHGGEAKLVINEQTFALATESTEIRSRLIEASYPKYQQVIPEPNKEAFSAQRKDFIEAITTASLFLTRKEIAVRIKGAGKEIEVSCYDRFKAKIMGTELTGQPDQTKHVNYRMLLDTLGVLDNETVRIEVTETMLPIVVREGSYTEVINSLAIEG